MFLQHFKFSKSGKNFYLTFHFINGCFEGEPVVKEGNSRNPLFKTFAT